MTKRRVLLFALTFLVLAYSGHGNAAPVRHACDAERYKPCPSFQTSVSIGNHTPTYEYGMAGFTTSRGNWTVRIQYGPPNSCAVVKLLVDRGTLRAYGQYKRVFINGTGTIKDSGLFDYKTGDLDSALSIDFASCRVPAETSAQSSSQAAAPPVEDLEAALRTLESGSPESAPQGIDAELERLASAEEEWARELERERELKRERELEWKKRIEAADAPFKPIGSELLELVKERFERAKEEHALEQAQRRARAAQDLRTFLGIVGTTVGVVQGIRNRQSSSGYSAPTPSYGSAPSTAGSSRFIPACYPRFERLPGGEIGELIGWELHDGSDCPY